MKSKTAFFNKGICLNYLKRCWPLWVAYIVVLMMAVPGSILPQVAVERSMSAEELFWHTNNLNRQILYAGRDSVSLSAICGVIAAMAMYSFMYNSRSCSMMCALPVRRETVFVTAYFTGLVPMLAIDLLTVAFTALPALGSGFADGLNLWRLLLMLLLSNIAFYSFAVFCAVLTGNIVVLPAVYVVLNAAVVLAEQTVRNTLDIIVYGFNSNAGKLTGFSPLFAAGSWFWPESVTEEYIINDRMEMRETGEFIIDHFYVLFIYCAVGLALAALALYIYRRRNMECAGDVVAVPVLKPIFKYCMCFGVAFSFAVLVYNNALYRLTAGFGKSIVVLMLLLAGAFIGYFAAEMLMQKTLRVFRGKWSGFVVSALILTAFTFCAELDVTGYEKRVPDVADIKSASISYYETAELENPESLEKISDYHRFLIEQKDVNEHAKQVDSIVIDYKLENGTTLSRQYSIARDEAQILDENSGINRLASVVNLQEAIDKRAASPIPVTSRTVQDGMLTGYYVDENGEYHHFDYELSDEQVAELYNQCVLPDAAEGRLKRIFPINNEEYYSCATTVNFNFSLRSEDYRHYYCDFVMYMDAPRCLRWISENTDIELLPIKEADPRQSENDTIYLNYYKPVYEAASSTIATIG